MKKEAILRHAGWAIKRARDTVSESPDNNLMIEFTDMEASLSKTILLSIFKALGNDTKNSDDGKYYFVPNDSLVDLFQCLHVIVNDQLKLAINEAKEDAPSIVLHKLSSDSHLRKLWNDVLSDKSFDNPSKLFILHQVCFFFIKSKQKMVVETMNLNPNKKSVAQRNRAGLQSKSSTSGKSCGKAKSSCGKGKSKPEVPEEIKNMRSNFKLPDMTLKTVIEVFKSPDAAAHFGHLTGKELTCLLKALGKPCHDKKK